MFYNFALHPAAYKKLQQEIDEFMAGKLEDTDNLDHAAFAKLEYLQACIDESLRLHPAVPSGLQRQTPPEGLQVGDKWIPGNTIVQMPSYTMYRGEWSPHRVCEEVLRITRTDTFLSRST